eukprot:COSAG05_NODE_1094_length_5906_cov_299.271569_7_plen_84_part_00
MRPEPSSSQLPPTTAASRLFHEDLLSYRFEFPIAASARSLVDCVGVIDGACDARINVWPLLSHKRNLLVSIIPRATSMRPSRW